MENTMKITCPECGHQFSPNAAIEGPLRAHFEKEYAAKLANSKKTIEEKANELAQAAYQQKLTSMEKESSDNKRKLKELETKAIDFATKEKELNELRESMELTMRKQLLEKEKEIIAAVETRAREKAKLDHQEEIGKLKSQLEGMEISYRATMQKQIDQVRTQEQLKVAELEGKLEDQTRLANEMKRKIEQGSMQAQGEVLELELEELLKASFPFDSILEIPKGVNGCDSLHQVRNSFQQPCGIIAYETKRTKTFSPAWISKFKGDMMAAKADIGVLVTETMPKDMEHFGLRDGIWICSFAEVEALVFILRDSLLKLSVVKSQQENRSDKMSLLYEYLTSTEFAQKISSMITGFTALKANLEKEKRAMKKVWKEREKQIDLILNNTIDMHGTIKGIGGSSVKEIEELSLDNLLLEENTSTN